MLAHVIIWAFELLLLLPATAPQIALFWNELDRTVTSLQAAPSNPAPFRKGWYLNSHIFRLHHPISHYWSPIRNSFNMLLFSTKVQLSFTQCLTISILNLSNVELFSSNPEFIQHFTTFLQILNLPNI
jgi:hypothetical protein